MTKIKNRIVGIIFVLHEPRVEGRQGLEKIEITLAVYMNYLSKVSTHGLYIDKKQVEWRE